MAPYSTSHRKVYIPVKYNIYIETVVSYRKQIVLSSSFIDYKVKELGKCKECGFPLVSEIIPDDPEVFQLVCKRCGLVDDEYVKDTPLATTEKAKITFCDLCKKPVYFESNAPKYCEKCFKSNRKHQDTLRKRRKRMLKKRRMSAKGNPYI